MPSGLNLFEWGKNGPSTSRNHFRNFWRGRLPSQRQRRTSQYKPKDEQIPAPDCMNLHVAWDGARQAPCPADMHESWLQRH